MLYQTHVKVHLGNIRRNLETVRSLVGPERKLCFSVKDNAYGHGAVKVASMVQEAGLADWFGVTTVPEGLELRAAGVHLPILKFSPTFPEEMDAAVDGRITLTVCETSNIMALQTICAAKGITSRVHLKVETGMGRIGVAANDAAELAVFVERRCPNIYLEGVFSHLAATEGACSDRVLEGRVTCASFTQEQISLFRRTTDQITAALGRKLDLLHCSNSGGVVKYEKAWLSMVRFGQVAYGWADNKPDSMTLYPGMSLFTRLSFLKKVKRGASIGYGCTWSAPEDTWIGTMPVGWGDGFSRAFSNCGRVLVNGVSYPIVGLMCMDQSMINLGPDRHAQVGDEVVLLGRSGDREITLQDLATLMKTVPWETVAMISPRVQRVYD